MSFGLWDLEKELRCGQKTKNFPLFEACMAYISSRGNSAMAGKLTSI